jgi:hypothetical protein
MPTVRREFGKGRVSCEDYIKIALKEIARDIAEGIHIYQNRDMLRALVTKGTEVSGFMYVGEFF